MWDVSFLSTSDESHEEIWKSWVRMEMVQGNCVANELRGEWKLPDNHREEEQDSDRDIHQDKWNEGLDHQSVEKLGLKVLGGRRDGSGLGDGLANLPVATDTKVEDGEH
ncbi:hypothetical protein GCK72_012129 [Caenorhabditis remanei]|uniref:Uncharacterized protein n=1 Tax=Caenorhabditis remanei TaxID=31234 RepID=A0A6A5GMW0_CAERE|nr:hypothetical protein GCK72_012129 [Caenorhabditis remanei]KAF1755679.1 hypothetical protein GCK72_012129 [Caenorhabditis remanei]